MKKLVRKRHAVAVGILASALALTGCGGGGSDDGTGGASPTGDPVAGGTLNAVVISEPRTLDPAFLSPGAASNGLIGGAIYGTLMTYDPATMEPIFDGSIAESFETTDGGSTFTLKLREGVTFSDGTPFNAEAVKFGWDRLRNPELGSSAIGQALYVAETTAVDETTLEVKMTAPLPTFASVIANSALNWIGSPTALEAGAASFDANPIGAGPFTLTTWARQDRMDFAKNANYFNAPLPYLDGMVVRATPDTVQRFNMLTSGQVDLSFDNSSAKVADAKDQGFQAVGFDFAGGNDIRFNFAKAPFDDIRARQAVALGIDRQLINDIVYTGHATTAWTLFSEDSPYYNAELKYPERDEAKAKELIEELAAEGKPLNFSITSFPTTENRLTAETIQAQLNALGAKVEIETLDFVGAQLAMSNGEFQVGLSALVLPDPGIDLWASLHSESRQNRLAFANAEMDAALAGARSTASVEERKPFFETIQKLYIEEIPTVNYMRYFGAAVGSSKLGGLESYGAATVRPDTLWLSN